MSRATALARRLEAPAIEFARIALVAGCAAALIAAGSAFPLSAL